MIETPAALGAAVPRDRLARYAWHTGAPLRPLDPDEPCPVLFRDVGPEATARFLTTGLERLAGPLTPLTYLRTAAWEEPYVDHGRIGRLVFLRPLLLGPWHSGVPSVYVARATRTCAGVGFVPGTRRLDEVAALLDRVGTAAELREALGGREYDDECRDNLARIHTLEADRRAVERWAGPLRERLQSPHAADREAARRFLRSRDLGEGDLCAAWHHLPAGRRARLRAVEAV